MMLRRTWLLLHVFMTLGALPHALPRLMCEKEKHSSTSKRSLQNDNTANLLRVLLNFNSQRPLTLALALDWPTVATAIAIALSLQSDNKVRMHRNKSTMGRHTFFARMIESYKTSARRKTSA